MRLFASYIDAVRVARLTALGVLASMMLAGLAGAQTEAGQEESEPLPRCFGAASLDPVQPCRNPRLARMVFPKPLDALLEPNSPCRIGEREGELTPCSFGADPASASETIALIGDSHAAHWRAALDAVMEANNWTGVSFTKAGCPLSTAISDLPARLENKCARFKRQLFRWFERHPEVRTVVTSNHTGGQVVGAGDRDYSAHVEGYAEAMSRLLGTVQRIIAIRDVPRNTSNSMACVQRAMRRKVNAGPACAVPRRWALKPDPAKAAAAQLDPARVQLVDLTRFLCSPRLCQPVIGGALVHKDQTHLTRVYATTLGPYLLRHVRKAYTFFAPS